MADTNYYPAKKDIEEGTARTTLEFPESMMSDVRFVAELWNALDGHREIDREKWVAARVIRRLVRVGLDGFWAEVGGRPHTTEGRDQFLARAVDALEKRKAEQAKKPKK